MTDERATSLRNLEMLMFKTLALESIRGYGIAMHIEQISASVFPVNLGACFLDRCRDSYANGNNIAAGQQQRFERSPLIAPMLTVDR
jgi:hypothetical protein